MSGKHEIQFDIEPERYELLAGPAYHFEIDRRDFFKAFGGGIVVALVLKDSIAQESGGGRRGRGAEMPRDLGAWLHIAEDGKVTVYTGKVEIGQDIRTSLAQVVAEELKLPVSAIQLVMGDTDLTPYDMGTFGSLTTRTMSPQLRKVAATAREMLIDLASERSKADRRGFAVESGKVVNRSAGQSFNFGDLTKGQKLARAIVDDVQLTRPTEWKVAGTPVKKVNASDIVTGRHRYTSDVKLPGMLYGKVVRASAIGASLESIDTHAAEAIPGVTVVRDADFAGVAAADPETASRAVAAIKTSWKSTPQPSSGELFEYLKKNASNSGGSERTSRFSVGSIDDGLAKSDKKLQQSYTVAYIAHAPLEPRAAVAEWKDGKLTVWTGTQRPFGVRSELAQAFHLPENRVRVIVPDTGSGYGGKHTGETAIEAARLAKAAGKPVKVVWTREEEFTWAYFRPAGVIDVSSGVTSDGKLLAWEFHNYNSGGSAIRTLYDVPNQTIEFHPVRSPLRQGSYRALAATANHFAREVHMDEVAHAVKMDPLKFRLKNLKDERLRAVLEAAADKFHWDSARVSPGAGYGIAGGSEKGSYVASCVEVFVNRSGQVKIVRAVTAFECGPVINPDNLKNQIEGSVIMGLGGALFETIEFENGAILNPRFSRYRVPRFSDVPALETVLVDRKDLPPVGAGETPIVAIAPALSNAIFDATAMRIRSLPMAPNGIKRRADVDRPQSSSRES